MVIGVVAGGIVFYRKRSRARSNASFPPNSGGGGAAAAAPVPPPYSTAPAPKPAPYNPPPMQTRQRAMPSDPYAGNLGITIEDEDTMLTAL